MGINVGRNQLEWTPVTVFFPKKLYPRIASKSLFFWKYVFDCGLPMLPIYHFLDVPGQALCAAFKDGGLGGWVGRGWV